MRRSPDAPRGVPSSPAAAVTRHIFIADLHLRPTPAAHAALEQLLEGCGTGCALYVLGDLFDLWLGDDIDLPRYGAVTQTLRGFQSRGGAAYVMVGNHDFLLGADFFAATGVHPLPDPTVLELGEQRWLLTHGDLLCTADVDYQSLRKQIRNPEYVQGFLALPPARRMQMARELQDASRTATAHKADTTMDLDPVSTHDFMKAHDATVLVHGHTHRPGVEAVSDPGPQATTPPLTRITLGSWACGPSACIWEDGNYRLVGIPA